MAVEVAWLLAGGKPAGVAMAGQAAARKGNSNPIIIMIWPDLFILSNLIVCPIDCYFRGPTSPLPF
jgi:hypothetical protein